MKPENTICITNYIRNFKDTLNFLYLIKAVILVFQQGRVIELLYGFYCFLFHPPSKVYPDNQIEWHNIAMKFFLNSKKYYNREELISLYRDKNNLIEKLPESFFGARAEGVILADRLIIVGEYWNDYKEWSSARRNVSKIYCIDNERCRVIDFYTKLKGVVHIHALHMYKDNSFFVSTGDSSKFLDLWMIHDDINVIFIKRIKKIFAGYTAMITVGNDFYFGTDFSSRPNYLESLSGEKFFFPDKSYRLHVDHFFQYLSRYIISVNSSFFNKRAISVFDTKNKRFVYCDYF